MRQPTAFGNPRRKARRQAGPRGPGGHPTVAQPRELRCRQEAAGRWSDRTAEVVRAVGIAGVIRCVQVVGAGAEALEHYRGGNALYAAHKLDEAIGEYRRAVELCPGDAKFQNNLGATLFFCDKIDEAIPHLDESGRAGSETCRGDFLSGAGPGDQGTNGRGHRPCPPRVDMGISSPQPLAWLAWQLSTVNDASLRNAADAVQFAEKACGMTERKDPAVLDALAAAYAASGRFDEAVQTATEAQRLASAAGNRPMSEALLQRITLYSDRKPFYQN